MTLSLAKVNETWFLSLDIFLEKYFTAIVYFYQIAGDEPVCPVTQEHSLSSSSCAEGAQLRPGKSQPGGLSREAEGQTLGQESVSRC